MIISELRRTYSYSIREGIMTHIPETQGPLLAIKKTWDEACEYRDKLYEENRVQSYISVVVT